MAFIDDAVQVLKFTGKTALWSLGVVVGIRVLAPVILPYCKPLVKEAAKGYAALLDKLQSVDWTLSEPQEAAEVGMAEPVVKAAGVGKSPKLAPVKAKTMKVATATAKAVEVKPAKAKIATLRPYQQWSKAELYERAKELAIAGRSTMNKAQLIKAIRAASR